MNAKTTLNRASLLALAVASALAGNAEAIAVGVPPNISRLTPPSNPISASATTLSRFAPGQKFDLQATVRPDSGATISTVVFKVDGATVATLTNNDTTANQFSGSTGLVKTGLVSGLPANSVVASLRGYSNATAGMHTLTAEATDSNGAITTKTGNFEVVPINLQGRLVKNIIIMLGDGMGSGHRTAARIMAKGYAQGKAKGMLAMDTFPFTGMVMTSSLNSIVTDSAPGMANYVNGNKANNNQEGVFPDDTTAAFDNPRIEYLSEYLKRTKGKSLGIVTTADVFDATPAANAVHTQDRGAGTGINDQYLDDRGLTGLTVLMGGGRKWFLPNASNSISPQPVNGSQRRTSNDYTLTSDIINGWGAAPGALDNERDLIADFQAAGFAYAPDKSGLDSAMSTTPDKLLGLFAFSNMNIALDKINGQRGTSTVVNDYGFPDQPMLDDMTSAALTVLSRNPNGFILMAEGASIDKQAHLMDSERWMLDTIEFDKAVQVAKDFVDGKTVPGKYSFTAHPDTLVIVTADHECAGAAIIGASMVSNDVLTARQGTGTGTDVNGNGTLDPADTAGLRLGTVGTYDAAKFPQYTMSADGYPATTDVDNKMLIGYGANADRYETWKTNLKPTQDSQQPFVGSTPLNTYPANPNVRNSTPPGGFLVIGQVPGEQAVHTATDIPLSAYGRGASRFTGVFDNTDVFFKLTQAVLGGTP